MTGSQSSVDLSNLCRNGGPGEALRGAESPVAEGLSESEVAQDPAKGGGQLVRVVGGD